MPSETFTLSADADRSRLPEVRAKCKIQPMVMIFDSKPRRPRQKHTKSPRKSSVAPSGKSFAFVNISRPGEADEDARRLVKTHAMQDVLRRKPGDRFKLEVRSHESLCLSRDFPRSMENPPQAPPSNLLTFPIQTEPYMLRLCHDYASAMLPTGCKVIQSAWYRLVMTDAALFHALLSTSALFGLHGMRVQRKHMLETIRLINDRLSGDGATSDGTITAILFMAKAEYYQGNYGAWSVHMDGVKRIVELRGGIEKLAALVQEKIYSTDLVGCIEIGAVPHFPAINIPHSLFSPYLCNLPPAIASLAEVYTLDADFLALLSGIKSHPISSSATYYTHSLQYHLLSLHATRQYGDLLPSFIIRDTPFCNQVQQAQSEIVQELLLIGALLFLSLPHMSELPPIRPVDYSYLLSRLTYLASLLFNYNTLPQHAHFLLWLSFLGEVFASASISGSTCAQQRWPFRLQLRDISARLKITSWQEMRFALGKTWAMAPKHEKPYRCLWEEAMADREMCY